MWHPGQSLSASKVPRQNSGLFFNSAIPLKQLRELGNIGEVREEDESPAVDTRQRLKAWLSKSAQNAVAINPVDFHEKLKASVPQVYTEALPLQHTPPPPGFGPAIRPSPQKEPPRPSWADYSLGANFTPTPTSSLQFNWEIVPENEVQAPAAPMSKPDFPVLRTEVESKEPVLQVVPEGSTDVQLRLPPKKQKRAERGTFQAEEVKPERVRGVLKFYHLKKRFGFVTLERDGCDIFICEDDLVLSGVNHKQFKEDVAAGQKPLLEFSVKLYWEKDKEKKKAIDIVALGYA